MQKLWLRLAPRLLLGSVSRTLSRKRSHRSINWSERDFCVAEIAAAGAKAIPSSPRSLVRERRGHDLRSHRPIHIGRRGFTLLASFRRLTNQGGVCGTVRWLLRHASSLIRHPRAAVVRSAVCLRHPGLTSRRGTFCHSCKSLLLDEGYRTPDRD
jgi:hypothetical protein